MIHASEKVSNCTRMAARSTTQVESIALEKLISRRKEKELQMQTTKDSKAAKATNAKRSALYLTGLKADVARAS